MGHDRSADSADVRPEVGAPALDPRLRRRQRFVMLRQKGRPSLPATHNVVTQNWFEKLKRLVPTKGPSFDTSSWTTPIFVFSFRLLLISRLPFILRSNQIGVCGVTDVFA